MQPSYRISLQLPEIQKINTYCKCTTIIWVFEHRKLFSPHINMLSVAYCFHFQFNDHYYFVTGRRRPRSTHGHKSPPPWTTLALVIASTSLFSIVGMYINILIYVDRMRFCCFTKFLIEVDYRYSFPSSGQKIFALC